MIRKLYTSALFYLFLIESLPSHCFLHNHPSTHTNTYTYRNIGPIFATKSKLKAVRKFTRDRPKKTRPSAIYPSPTLYYGNVQDHFGSPPEYLPIPVDKTLNILRNGKLSVIVSHMKKGITGSELSELLSDKQFFNALSLEVSALKEIAEYEGCDVSCDLHMYFDRILKSPTEYEHYIDKFYTIKKLQSYWERREQTLYNIMLKRLFSRLRSVAHKIKDSGISFSQFSDPKLWHKFGVFKLVPNCRMAENYLAKHRIALNFDIKNLYYRDTHTNKIESNFSKFMSELSQAQSRDPNQLYGGECEGGISNTQGGETNTTECPKAPTEDDCYTLYSQEGSNTPKGAILDDKGRLHRDLVDRIISDLAQLGVLDPAKPWTMNLSRVEELESDFSTEAGQHAYAIRDFYLSLRYPEYRVESDPYVLESFLNHQYRTKTFERDLLRKYNAWVCIGAPRETFKPMNLKYQHLAIWHNLSKNHRRRLAQKYVKTIAAQEEAQASSSSHPKTSDVPPQSLTPSPPSTETPVLQDA